MPLSARRTILRVLRMATLLDGCLHDKRFLQMERSAEAPSYAVAHTTAHRILTDILRALMLEEM